jgi:hypothetical protein
VAVLNLIQQNPTVSFDSLVHGADYHPTAVGTDADLVTTDDSDDPVVSGSAVTPTLPATAQAGEPERETSIDDKFKAFKL